MVDLNLREWYDISHIRTAIENGEFPEYEAEVDRIFNSPQARWCKFKKRDRSRDEIATTVKNGKIGEIFLRTTKERVFDLNATTLEKFGSNHKYHDQIKRNLYYHDLIDSLSGSVIEVKWWAERFCDNFDSDGWRGLISAIRKKDHMFPDKVIIFAKDHTGNRIRFHKCFDVETLLMRG